MPSFVVPKPPPKSPYAKPDVPYIWQGYPKWIESKLHGGKRLIVNSVEEHALHIGEPVEEVIREAEIHVMEAAPEYKPQPYPRWVASNVLGKRVIVENHEDEEYHTGVVMNEDGTPFVEPEPEPLSPAVAPLVDLAGAGAKRGRPRKEIQTGAEDGDGWGDGK